jgi:GxxExxY protein
MKPNQLSEAIIGAAVEVHRTLGPGLLPSTYEHCLCHELALRGIPFKSNVPVPLTYKGKPLGETSQVGLLVADKIIVQPLAVKALEPVHQAEMLSQLRLSQHNLGLLLNFNVPSLIQGVRRCKI